MTWTHHRLSSELDTGPEFITVYHAGPRFGWSVEVASTGLDRDILHTALGFADRDDAVAYVMEVLEWNAEADFHNDAAAAAVPVGPCPCECNRGGFCGGCGHAGCGRRVSAAEGR